MPSILASKIQTPSGLVFPNRLVKASMAESMAENFKYPGDMLISAYTTWGSGQWGGLLTGNVDVSTVYRGNHYNVTVEPEISEANRKAWEQWALAAQREGTSALVQLVHPGRQSPAGVGDRGFFDKSIAPSAVPLNLGDSWLDQLVAKVAFGTPREMTLQDIEEVIQQFAAAAKFAYESGFKGVELHAAHGYLLTQFLSPKLNLRTDAYGGTAAKRAKIVIDIIRAVRKEVPASFCVGIKLNSADVAGHENLEENLEQVGLISREQIDFLEISGGTYENFRMAYGDEPKARRTIEREAFFLDYAQTVRERYPNLILMVTGGFRSREGMIKALESKACDLIGVGRPAAVYPHLPKDVMLNEEVKDGDAYVEFAKVRGNWLVRHIPLKMLGMGVDQMHYVKQIHNLGEGKKTEPPPKAQ